MYVLTEQTQTTAVSRCLIQSGHRFLEIAFPFWTIPFWTLTVLDFGRFGPPSFLDFVRFGPNNCNVLYGIWSMLVFFNL